MLKNQRLVGALCVLLSNLTFALAPTFAKFAYKSNANALGVLIVRFTFAAAVMLVLRKVVMRGVAWPTRRNVFYLLGLGMFGYAAAALSYFTAIDSIDTGLAIVIFYCNPLLVVLATWIIYKRRPTGNIVFALVFTLMGVAITAGQIGGASTTAILLVLLSSVAFALYSLGSAHVLKQVDVLTGVAVVLCGAAIGFWMYWLITPSSLAPHFPDRIAGWAYIAALALVSTIFSTGMFFAGLRRLGPSLSSIVATIEPVLAIIAGVLFLGEALTVAREIGAALVIGSLLALSVLEARTETVPLP